MRKRKEQTSDPVLEDGLRAIGALEQAIVRAHDEKIAHGISAEELARLRPAVVKLAAAVAGQLRTELLARGHQS